jgi:hypothetical protein
MPNSLSIARLALNCVWTLLGVLAAQEREVLLRPALPALVRICRAFPPLMEDTVQVGLHSRIGGLHVCPQLLTQAARMWISSQSVQGYSPPRLSCTAGPFSPDCTDVGDVIGDLPSDCSLSEEIVKTFEAILGETVFARRVF